jgi:hypothetical protein
MFSTPPPPPQVLRISLHMEIQGNYFEKNEISNDKRTMLKTQQGFRCKGRICLSSDYPRIIATCLENMASRSRRQEF